MRDESEYCYQFENHTVGRNLLMKLLLQVQHRAEQGIELLLDNMLHTRYRIKEMICKINKDPYECAEYRTVTMTNDDELFFRPTKSYRRKIEWNEGKQNSWIQTMQNSTKILKILWNRIIKTFRNMTRKSMTSSIIQINFIIYQLERNDFISIRS